MPSTTTTNSRYSFSYFTQVCRQCKRGYKKFKIDLSNYDKDGKISLESSEIFERFSFTCEKCELTNVLNFAELCSKETILFLKKRSKELQKGRKRVIFYLIK